MKIFGIGLSKTGTTSLTAALSILGYNSRHYPRSWLDFEDYEAVTDIPVSCRFKELDSKYPGSKFILTTRDVQKWFSSVIKKPLDQVKPTEWALENRRLTYDTTLAFDKEKWLTAYYRHHKEVRAYFAKRNDLLMLDLDANNKWELLCDFLEKPVPPVPYPWENKFQKRLFL